MLPTADATPATEKPHSDSPLNDDELVRLWREPSADLSLLTPDELTRLDRLTQVWYCPHCERPEDQLPVRNGRSWGVVPDARGESQRVCLDCVDAFDASVRVQKFCEAPLDGPIH